MSLQDVEDRFAKGNVHAGCHLCGTWRGSSYGSGASHRDGLSVPDRAVWLRKSQADPYLQNRPKVSILSAKCRCSFSEAKSSSSERGGVGSRWHRQRSFASLVLLWAFLSTRLISMFSIYCCYDVIVELNLFVWLLQGSTAYSDKYSESPTAPWVAQYREHGKTLPVEYSSCAFGVLNNCIFFCFFRGHSPEWYNKGFGHLCAAEVARIRNSFQPLIAEGPETKIWGSVCGNVYV